jgi:uncharacterized integral membrane protein
MSLKTIFIIIVSALLTLVLMNNTEEIHLWLFGDMKISKLVVLGIMFALGFIVGALAARPAKKNTSTESDQEEIASSLSDEDRAYIE